MSSTSGTLRWSLNDHVLRNWLVSLKREERDRILSQAARKALNPVRNELRRAWRGAKRRRGTVTRKIAQYQEIRWRVPQRGAGKGYAYAEVGTNYARGGMAKLWHILEHGAAHYGSHRTYRPDPAEVRRAASYVASVRSTVNEAWKIDERRAAVAAAHKAGALSKHDRDRKLRELSKESDAALAWKMSGNTGMLQLAARRRVGRDRVRNEARHIWDPEKHGDPNAGYGIARGAQALLSRTGLVPHPKHREAARAAGLRASFGMRRLPGFKVSTQVVERALPTVQREMYDAVWRGVSRGIERAQARARGGRK